ncbi:MAG: hypothetical protein ACREM8_14615, partial [Vulcanimicrobiaceae bacterium]
GQIVPAGAPYDVSALPTAPPTTSPSPGMATPTPTPVPSPLPVVPNASSVELLGQAASGVALVTGPAAGGLLALTSLTNAPPQYGSFVPFANQNNAYPINPPKLPRTTVRVNPFGFGYALVRGPSDLLDYSITDVATGFEFSAVADDTTLGTGAVTLYGRADIAFDPGNSGRALIGGTTSGSLTTLTLVTGLPTSITKTATLTLPANIRSIVIGPSGQYAVVGTDAGIAVVNGVNGSSLSLVAPFAPGGMPDLNILTYLGCDGKTTLSLTNVDSVELSTDDRYLVALGAPPGIACPNGYDASIVAIPFNPNSGATPSPSPTTAPSPGATPSPNPTMFTQNLVVPPPTGADLMVVR